MLTSQAVVGDPFLFVVVFGPGDVALVPDVHVDAWEFDLPDDAKAFDGLHHGVEQPVGQARQADDAGCVLAEALVAFGLREPGPEGGGEQVAAQLLAAEGLQQGAGVLRVGLCGLQGGLGLAEAVFELGELAGADAGCADADGAGLAGHVAGVGAQVPLGGVGQCGEAAHALQVFAQGEGGLALGEHLAVEADAGQHADEVAGQAAGQLLGAQGAAVWVGRGQVAGNQVGVGLAGGGVAEGEALACELGYGGLDAEDFVAPGVTEGVLKLVAQCRG